MNRIRTVVIAAVASLVAALAIGAVGASTAAAQGPGSQFCEQYPSFPGCQKSPNEPPVPVGEPPALGSPSADTSAAGSLPFTGYPLTALILLLLILLLTGIAIRAYMALRDRVIDDHAGH